MKRVTIAYAAVGGLGLFAVVAWLLSRQASQQMRAKVADAVTTGGTFNARITGYWPYQAGLTPKERRMEGGTRDRRSRPIHTLEQHLADPVAHPYVSVAGDDAIFPYGQRLILSAWPDAVFRVVDTGGHFRGVNKLYRVAGREPLDIAVDSSKTLVPKKGVTAKIVHGDNWEKGRLVATAKMRDVAITGIARVVEACGTDIVERQAVAWALRNRAEVADDLDVALVGYPEAEPDDESTMVALAVSTLPIEDDPTGGAVDFWRPREQGVVTALGALAEALDVDEETIVALAPFLDSPTEEEARSALDAAGLVICGVAGGLELLGHV